MPIMKSLAALLLAAVCGASLAQTYPSRPITLVNPFPPGGTADFVGRLVAQKLGDTAGWRVVSDNKPGATGQIGTKFVAIAAPDGYTLLLGPSSTHATGPAVFRNLPYDVLRDFTGVTMLGSTANVMAVNPAVPAASVKELIAHARANPGKLAYASTGDGTGLHITGEMFKDAAGIDLLHVPFKGSAPAMLAVIGGEVQIVFENISGAVPNIKAGRLRALAVTSAKRDPVLPDVPTLLESGMPGFETLLSWFSVFAPAATPREVVNRLNVEIVKVLNLPEVRELMLSRGLEPRPMGVDQFNAQWRSDLQRYAAIAKKANISLD